MHSTSGACKRVELPATLALALILDPTSPRERQREQVCEFRSADNLASDVADDAAEHRADAPQGSGSPLELLGVGIALVPDQRDLADPQVGLAQGYAPGLGEAHQALACTMHQLGIRAPGVCSPRTVVAEVGRVVRLASRARGPGLAPRRWSWAGRRGLPDF